MVASEMEPIQKQVNASIIQNSFAGFIIMIVAIILGYYIASLFTKPIVELKNITEHLAKGDINYKFNHESKDEIEVIAIAFNKLLLALNKTAEFSNEIGKGNYNHEYKILSDKDTIGKSLLSMRDNLKIAQNNEEDRKEKERLENWANQGIAKFGEILRSDANNMENLALNFIQNLVKYLDIVQGGLFVLNEENPNEIVYELKGAVAFDRKKKLQKNIALGEGLVGRCAFESLPIILTDVPDNYINITSGLGDANPTSILLIPSVLNNKVYAVIELVSFENFNDFEIKFVINIGENLASTIANIKTNIQTQKLLEETSFQREELSAKEEEMRQNLEELQATQEEMKRKELELTKLNEELQSKLNAQNG